MICDSVINHLTGSLVAFQSQSPASFSHLAPDLTLLGCSFLICDSSFLVLQNVLLYLLQGHVGLKFLETQAIRPRKKKIFISIWPRFCNFPLGFKFVWKPDENCESSTQKNAPTSIILHTISGASGLLSICEDSRLRTWVLSLKQRCRRRVTGSRSPN